MNKIIALFCLGFLVSCVTKPPAPTVVSESYKQQDYSRTFNALLPSAKSGEAESQYALGYLYYYGLGGAKDHDLALYWIRKAADQHYPPAREALVEVTKGRESQSVRMYR